MAKTRRPKRQPKVHPLPVSAARNAYELVLDVIQAMREEPRRVNLNTYCRKVSGKNAPACGTVGCFAGWIVMLALSHYHTILASQPFVDFASIATTLLGEDLDYSDGDDKWVFDSEWEEERVHPAGTKQYVELVIRKRIRPFLRRNAKALRARKFHVGLMPVA